MIERTAKKKFSSGQTLYVTDRGEDKPNNPYIECGVITPTGTKHAFAVSVKELLDLVISLWPDEIAYQFKDNDGDS